MAIFTDIRATVAAISLFTFVLNIPFGYWRAGARRFSVSWFLAIHLPVPFIVAARIWLRAPWVYIPVFLASYFIGQYAGALIRAGRAT